MVEGKEDIFTKEISYPTFRQIGEDGQRAFLASAVSPLPSAQNNPIPKLHILGPPTPIPLQPMA